MAAVYYNLDSEAERDAMHSYYKLPNTLSIYLVNLLEPGGGNTAYCIVWSNKYYHTDSNVFSVYSPNVWDWQSVIAHENGHAIGYLQDQYLYNECGCTCGDDTCLGACIGYTPFLHSDPNACYNGNLMHYNMVGWNWNQYDITVNQWQFINEFHYLFPGNFHWN